MGPIIDFTTGSPARESDFFFRTEFLADLTDSLRREHVLILAPRRMGKTSVMLRLRDEPPDGRLVLFLNVEELSTPAELCQNLITALHEQHPKYLRQTLASAWSFLTGPLKDIKSLELYKFKIALRRSEPDWEANWRAKADELVASLRRTRQPLLIILDELPDLVLNMQKRAPDKLETFLHWFRGVRQNPREDNLRWLVGGSVNLRTTLNKQGMLNLINDLRVEPLPPFSEAEVEEFVSTMLQMRDVGFEPGVVTRITELLGEPIPFFLQLLTQELFRHWRRTREALQPSDVDTVFHRVLLGEVARDKLQHFRSRIHSHYPEGDKQAALELLSRISASDEPVRAEALRNAYSAIESTRPQPRSGPDVRQAFNDLMAQLHNDFYVEQVEGDCYDFASRTLKLWWRKYYG